MFCDQVLFYLQTKLSLHSRPKKSLGGGRFSLFWVRIRFAKLSRDAFLRKTCLFVFANLCKIKFMVTQITNNTPRSSVCMHVLHDKYPTCTLLILYEPPLVSPPHLRPLAIFWGPKVMSGFGLNEIRGSEVDVLVTFNYFGCLRSQDPQAGPSMDPKLITTHDTGEVGFLDNIFYPNSDKGRLGSMKRFSSGSGPDMAPKWPQIKSRLPTSFLLYSG